MTDKMPDEMPESASDIVGIRSAYVTALRNRGENMPIATSLVVDIVGHIRSQETRHAEEIAALEARHRALQGVHSDSLKFINFLQAEHRAVVAGLCDEIYGMKGVPDEPTELASSSQISAYNEACDDCIELIKQRISDV